MIFRKKTSRIQTLRDNNPNARYEAAYPLSKREYDTSQLPHICAVLCVLVVVVYTWNSQASGSLLDDLTLNMIIGGVAGGVGALIGKLINALLKGWLAWAVLMAVISLGFLGFCVYVAAHPITVAGAQKQAVRWYPQLGVANSPLNREFVARYNRYQATNPQYFKDPHWPLRLAAECNADLVKGGTQ